MAVDRDNKTGFVCSSFDIYHTGYSLMLKYCKDHCDYLVVGLQEDPSWERQEKNSPVKSLHSRWLILKSISYIDEIAPYKNEKELSNLLNFYAPDVRFLGEDYRDAKQITGPNGSVSPRLVKNIHFVPRSHEYSSSGIRKEIYKAAKYREELYDPSHMNPYMMDD